MFVLAIDAEKCSRKWRGYSLDLWLTIIISY